MAVTGQPIIRGIQAVGSVDVWYKYNGNGGKMVVPEVIKFGDNTDAIIDTSKGIKVAGFRLDGEFLRANPQIASSVVIPILGGGGVALANNNRTGVLNLTCAKVSTPDVEGEILGAMYTPGGSGIGVVGGSTVFDMVTLAQVQQAQVGGDSAGSTIGIHFGFCGLETSITFEGCTIATVDPLALTGNDAATYQIAIPYLNWSVEYGKADASLTPFTISSGASASA